MANKMMIEGVERSVFIDETNFKPYFIDEHGTRHDIEAMMDKKVLDKTETKK